MCIVYGGYARFENLYICSFYIGKAIVVKPTRNLSMKYWIGISAQSTKL